VSPKLPQVSGKDLVKFLERLEYQVVRQRGSHVQMRKTTVNCLPDSIASDTI